MKTYKQALNQCFIDVACIMLFGLLSSVSPHAVAVAPTPEQKLEFELYIAVIFVETAQLGSTEQWRAFHRNNTYIRPEILGYTVPKKIVENSGSFVAHGIVSFRGKPGSKINTRIIYRFNGDGSYWVAGIPSGFTTENARIDSLAEFLAGFASNARQFIVETAGENAVRKWAGESINAPAAKIEWDEQSIPSLQEALDAYNLRVFYNPVGGDGPLDIEAGDPSLKSIKLSLENGIELDELELVDSEVETALRRTMIINRLVQLRYESPSPTYTGILKEARKEVFNMTPTEVKATYGALKNGLPKGPDYEYPPGCAND